MQRIFLLNVTLSCPVGNLFTLVSLALSVRQPILATRAKHLELGRGVSRLEIMLENLLPPRGFVNIFIRYIRPRQFPP